MEIEILTSKITGRFSGGLRRVELSYPASKTVVKAALRVCRFPLFPSSPTPNAKTELWRGKMGEAVSRIARFFSSAAHLPPPLRAVAANFPVDASDRRARGAPGAPASPAGASSAPRFVGRGSSLFFSSQPPGGCWIWRGVLFEILYWEPHTLKKNFFF